MDVSGHYLQNDTERTSFCHEPVSIKCLVDREGVWVYIPKGW